MAVQTGAHGEKPFSTMCLSWLAFTSLPTHQDEAPTPSCPSPAPPTQLLWHCAQGSASPLHRHIQMLPGKAPGTCAPCVGMLFPAAAVEQLQYPPLEQDIANHQYWYDAFWEGELAPLQGSPDSPFQGLPLSKADFGGWADVEMRGPASMHWM